MKRGRGEGREERRDGTGEGEKKAGREEGRRGAGRESKIILYGHKGLLPFQSNVTSMRDQECSHV